MRPTKDEYYIGIAEAVSKRSTCLRRNYGAVLVKDDVIIATGYNGSARGEVNCCDTGYCARDAINAPHNSGYTSDCPAIHAEENCLLNVDRQKAIGSTLYLWGWDCKKKEEISLPEPCVMCKRLIITCGVARIVSKSTHGYFNRQGQIRDMSTYFLRENRDR